MELDIQSKLKNDQKMRDYLNENSYWYKQLNRNPLNYKRFVETMKDMYKIRTTDKISSVIDNIDIIGNVLDIFK